ncbi:unnamed protein product [Blepharisma stoltei]|uniref:ZZ-type domain-containing protein n=1 Tax=Blepharisma stoltei TaxID=1481888 RepID=A0AAU9K979_9CILI|nr:unnamed protein product [Blepharisma stoltei]
MNGIRFLIGSEKVQTIDRPDSFSALRNLAEKKVPNYQILQIAYEDPDGDHITILGDADLIEAKKTGKKLNGFLLLYLKGNRLTESFMTQSTRSESYPDVEVIEDGPPAPQSLPAPFEKEDFNVPCYACGGKFDRCGICLGNGVLDSRQDPKLNTIVALIRNEMQNYLPKLLNAIESSKSEVVHQNVTCDSCGMSPIIGHRYKCSVCQNFDFCGKCEANAQHEHPFIKIRTPEQVPKTIICAVDETEAKSKPKAKKPAPAKCKNRQCEAETRLLCRFVKDVVGHEGDKITANTNFIKVWRLRNEGKNPWPNGCKLVCINGDFTGRDIPLPPLMPGEEEDITANCTSPSEEGRYTSYWRAVDPEGSRFGQRVWITINVVKPKEEFDNKVQTLMDMFNNPEIVRMALEKTGGDLVKATEALLSGSVIK